MTSFHYERPGSTEAILARLEAKDRKISILAGGTDLLSQIRSRLVRPELIVDIKGAKELQRLEATKEGLSIGAAVFLNRVLEQHEISAPYAALREAISDLASYQIRNRATLVGNVANASPCADTVPALCVMGASVEVVGPSGARQILVEQFITDNRETKLERDEFVARVVIPPLPAGTWSGFIKRKRVKGHDLALANAALLRDPERRRLRLSIGSCSPKPTLLSLDDMFDAPDPGKAARLAQDEIRPINDVRSSIEYRRDMVSLMVHRLFAAMDAEV
jgi:carbon-monoxide dehydrogenase medium subunit